VRSGRIRFLCLLGIIVGCATGGPHVFGRYADFSPRVAPQQGERVPQHLTIQLARPANVAVFLVVPGRASRLLFPADSVQSAYMEGGSHLVQTAAGQAALGDSSNLLRRPPSQRSPGMPRGGRGALSDSGFPRLGYNEHGYLLIVAAQQPMPYSVLSTRVAGISIPIDDEDALNTVTKLVRETTKLTGPWAAYAADFPP